MTRIRTCLPAFLLAAALSTGVAQARIVCTILADADTPTILKQTGTCDTRVTPASTFKLPISLMGYDAGFLKDAATPILPFKKGYPDWNAAWRRPIDPTTWIKYSVVWYSQQITHHLGMTRFQRYVSAFHYGNADVSGDPGRHNGLTRSWISSSLKISPLEQMTFLRSVVQRTLPVSAHAYDMTDAISLVETLSSGWAIHGKTGTAFPSLANGKDDEAHGYGWFVGWAIRGQERRVFVRLIHDEGDGAKSDGAKGDGTKPDYPGPRARADFLEELPELLGTP